MRECRARRSKRSRPTWLSLPRRLWTIQDSHASNLLTPELASHFTRPICDVIVGLACAPAQGQHIDLAAKTRTAYTHPASFVAKSAAYGHCSVMEASAELNRRIEEATTDLEVSKLRATLASLDKVGETVLSATHGVLQFIWAKISSLVATRHNGVQRLTLGTSAPRALSAKLVRPRVVHHFYEMLHYFIMLITALGISNAVLVMQFLDDVAHGAIRMGETWQVSFELVTLYLQKIDRDPTGKLHLGNVFQHGGQDTMLGNARRDAAANFPGGVPDDSVAEQEEA